MYNFFDRIIYFAHHLSICNKMSISDKRDFISELYDFCTYAYKRNLPNYDEGQMSIIAQLIIDVLPSETDSDCLEQLLQILESANFLRGGYLICDNFLAIESICIKYNLLGYYINTACALEHAPLMSLYEKYKESPLISSVQQENCQDAITACLAFIKHQQDCEDFNSLL
jgi:hypothetical protein